MKYKILLAGMNKTVIDDFFSHLNDTFECLTTSMRWEDSTAHIKYFRPDAFCYCAANDPKENISQMFSLKTQLDRSKIPFIFIGSEEDRIKFNQGGVIGMDDLILRRPIRVSAIEENIIKFLDGIEHIEQKRLKEEERAARAEEERFAKEAADLLAKAEAERLTKEAWNFAQNAAKRRHHILVVDDDSTMLKTIKDQLHEKYDVATAINGKAALRFLEKKSTDLILLDYEMPIESGPKVLERLRENEVTKDIPVVFLTGVTEREKIMQVLSLKPQGYLVKPIDNKSLMAEIEKVLFGGDQDE